MRVDSLGESVDRVRGFNRFYTRQIGVLQEGLLETPYSLTEARLIFELAHRQETTASKLVKDLGLDAGYMSRIVRDLAKRGILRKSVSKSDGRERLLRLAVHGRKAFAMLNTRAAGEVKTMLEGLAVDEQVRLLEAMNVIESVLDPQRPKARPYLLRGLRAGDIGWVIHRHGVLYAEEYGWDESFEALVAGIVAEFAKNHDAETERGWVAEVDSRIVGSVFCTKGGGATAKLRLLLVEPSARGQGIGSALVEECIHFAKQAGYKKVSLWTNSVLHAARRIYERVGFELIKEESHHSFGRDLTGQSWELNLRRE